MFGIGIVIHGLLVGYGVVMVISRAVGCVWDRYSYI